MSDNNQWNKRDQGTPPDLDEVVKQLQQKLSSFFGNNTNNTNNTNNNSNDNKLAYLSYGVIGLILLCLWLVAGIFIVGPAEKAVITRFGQYYKTVEAGLNWAPPFVDNRYIIDVENVSDYSYSSSMLTKDENIVLVELAVQYRVSNPKDYLFNVDSPVHSLQQATASALRHVVGHTSLSDILTIGREVVRQDVRKQLEQILSRYNTGLELLDVVMQPATPPKEVKDAFDDAIKAQEDEQRYKHQAEAYEKGVVPAAQGKAKRMLNEAQAYKEQQVLNAKGDVAKYDALLPEYKKAPVVTKDRLYFAAIESVLSNTSKVLLDNDGGNLTYLPLDKLLSMSTKDNNNKVNEQDELELAAANVANNSVSTVPNNQQQDTYRPRRRY